MNLIAFDTSTEYLSVAVRFDDVTHAEHRHVGQKHAEQTLPLLRDLLVRAGRTLQDADAIAVCNGPGSFTGLRIGCGLAQGLAFAAGLPVIAISTLAVLAAGSGARRAYACLDARMGQVYAAAYDRELDSAVVPIGLFDPDALPLPPGDGWIGCGSGFLAHGDTLAARLGPQLAATRPDDHPRADVLLELAATGRYPAVPPEQVELLYIRDKVALKTHERQAR